MTVRASSLVALAIALVSALLVWREISADEQRIASVSRGDVAIAVIAKLGEPSIRVERVMLSNLLFSPPAACDSEIVVSAYLYHRRWGRRAVLVYFDKASNVVCVARRGIGVLRGSS